MARKYDFTIESDEVYDADKAVRDFCDSHPDELSEDEHEELRGLLSNRASAISDALGIKVSSLCD